MGRLPLCSGLQEQQELGDPVLRLSRTAESLDNEDFSRKPFLFLHPDLFFPSTFPRVPSGGITQTGRSWWQQWGCLGSETEPAAEKGPQ